MENILRIIIPAVIAICSSVLAAWLTAKWTYKNNKILETERRKYEEKVLLISVQTELQCFQKTLHYIEDNFLDLSGDGFCPYLNTSHDKFSVYDGNAGRMGIINDVEIVKQIVECYGWITGLYDMLDDL